MSDITPPRTPWEPAPEPDPAAAREDAFDAAVRAGRDLAVEQLLAAADELGPDPRHAALTDDELITELGTSASAIAAATARFLSLIAELVVRRVWADQGAASPGEWLSWKLGIAPSTAREQVRVALRLRTLPKVAARFAAGTLSYSKVRAVTRTALSDDEDLLLQWADHATAAQLETIAAATRSAQRRATEEVQPDEDPAHRWRMRTHHDGTATISITGPVEDLAAFDDRVGRLAIALVSDRQPTDPVDVPGGDGTSGDGTSGDDPPGDDRPGSNAGDAVGCSDGSVVDGLEEEPSPHLRAIDRIEALCHVVTAAAAAETPVDTSGLDTHTLVLQVDADALAAPETATGAPPVGAADLTDADGPPDVADLTDADVPTDAESAAPADVLPAAPADVVPVRDPHRRISAMDRRVLRRLACGAGVVVAVMRDGTVMDVGRRRRELTAALRRAVHLRDRGSCRFPGCVATRHLHAHHVEHWADGGPTDLDNLVLLCARHHRYVHHHPVRIDVHADGQHTVILGEQPLAHSPALPGIPPDAVDGPVAIPDRASAEALTPPGYVGDRLDLDAAVSVLQHRYLRSAPLADAA